MGGCRVCGSLKKSYLFTKYGFDVVKCLSCGLIYTDFKPSEKFLRDFYSKDYFVSGKKKLGYGDYGKEGSSYKLNAQKRIKLLGLRSTGKVLDIGCAYGFFLSEVPSSWDKYGLEISKFACREARKINSQANIKNQALTNNVFEGKKFDLITLWDVIEHLDNPKETLEVAYSKLETGGKLALSTGDVDALASRIQGVSWHLFTPPQHLNFFSPKTINKLLASVGFKSIKIIHPSAYYTFYYLKYGLMSRYGINLPLPKFLRWIEVPVNLGDIMLVTAKK